MDGSLTGPTKSQGESELLERINQGLAAQDRCRYAELVARRETEDLTDEENAEFIRSKCSITSSTTSQSSA